jgi:type IV pilus assembly protein PilM
MRFIRDRFNIIRSRNDIIGLDIGCSAIKCVVLGAGNAKLTYCFKSYGLETISAGAAGNFNSKSNSLLVTRIKQVLEKAAVSSSYCVVALPDTLVNAKWIQIDETASENLEIAVSLAIEEHIPYPLDALYFDYQVFDQAQEDQGCLNVLVVACRKAHVDARLELIQQANLTPIFIEINSHAIERAYTHLYPLDNGTPFILVDVGATQWTLLFINASEKIQSYSESIAISDAETTLRGIQRGINTLCLRYPYLTFNKVLLIGSQRALLNFLIKRLENVYGIKTEIMAWNGAFLGKNVNEEFMTQFPALFLSFGLALRGFEIGP